MDFLLVQSGSLNQASATWHAVDTRTAGSAASARNLQQLGNRFQDLDKGIGRLSAIQYVLPAAFSTAEREALPERCSTHNSCSGDCSHSRKPWGFPPGSSGESTLALWLVRAIEPAWPEDDGFRSPARQAPGPTAPPGLQHTIIEIGSRFSSSVIQWLWVLLTPAGGFELIKTTRFTPARMASDNTWRVPSTLTAKRSSIRLERMIPAACTTASQPSKAPATRQGPQIRRKALDVSAQSIQRLLKRPVEPHSEWERHPVV